MPWIKSLHIISMICWFAGLICLPRLFINHLQSTDEAEQLALKQMEERLHHYIATPAMVFTWFFGLIMLFTYAGLNYSESKWLYLKAILVIGLTGYHFSMGYFVEQFKKDNNHKSLQFFQYYSKVPYFFLILIIILVIVKPF